MEKNCTEYCKGISRADWFTQEEQKTIMLEAYDIAAKTGKALINVAEELFFMKSIIDGKQSPLQYY